MSITLKHKQRKTKTSASANTKKAQKPKTASKTTVKAKATTAPAETEHKGKSSTTVTVTDRSGIIASNQLPDIVGNDSFTLPNGEKITLYGNLIWDEDSTPLEQTYKLCIALRMTGVVYTNSLGQIMRLEVGKDPRLITDTDELEGLIREFFSVFVFKGGKLISNTIPAKHLKILLKSPELQKYLPRVDRVTSTPTYTDDWQLTQPGFNQGKTESIFYTGTKVIPRLSFTKIPAFLKAMSFKVEADMINTIALALTIMLRHKWPGGKPFGIVTANKSHAGKDTILEFCSGNTVSDEVSGHTADWAMQNEIFNCLHNLDVGMLAIGNIRAGGAFKSAFLERTVTSKKPRLQSSKSSFVITRPADFVFTASANMAKFSVDLMNRSLPIHLELIGDIATRKSSIGNPREEYLPKYRNEIEAELLGMIENWKQKGCPHDTTVKHPMLNWAQTIGGILKANGYNGFLDNWALQKSANDEIREALGIIAVNVEANKWYRVQALVDIATEQGVLGMLMDSRHRETDKSIARELGVLLTAHKDEVVYAEHEDDLYAFKIKRSRISIDGTRAVAYQFKARGEVTK